MRIYDIIKGDKCYWRENKHFGYWSSFNLGSHEREDYFITTALILWINMRLCGIKARLEDSHKKGSGE